MTDGFGQSARGYFIMSYLGHKQCRVLHGGIEQWVHEGGNVTTAETTREARNYHSLQVNSSLIVTKNDVFEAIQNNNATLLDVRDVDEWIGKSSSPYGKNFSPRKGRLPKAKWLEWYRVFKPVGTQLRFKNNQEILAECENIGLDLSKPIILYCFKGARTSSVYLALKQAGVKSISTYFGSWNEWSRDLSLPIEKN